MKSFILFFLLMLSVSPDVYSQRSNLNNLTLPNNLENIETQEKLVKLAWANFPAVKSLNSQISIQREVFKQDKRRWLSNLGVSGNVNEFVLGQDEFNRAAFFPKYNISGRLDLGLLFLNPSLKRENRARISIAENELSQQKLLLRQEVLSSYQDLLKFLELYKIQIEITDDAYSDYLRSEQEFTNGKLALEKYNFSLQQYNIQRKEKIIAENAYLKAKYELEYYIGMKLEEALL